MIKNSRLRNALIGASLLATASAVAVPVVLSNVQDASYPQFDVIDDGPANISPKTDIDVVADQGYKRGVEASIPCLNAKAQFYFDRFVKNGDSFEDFKGALEQINTCGVFKEYAPIEGPTKDWAYEHFRGSGAFDVRSCFRKAVSETIHETYERAKEALKQNPNERPTLKIAADVYSAQTLACAKLTRP